MYIIYIRIYLYIHIQTTPARIYRANMMKLDAIELLSHTHTHTPDGGDTTQTAGVKGLAVPLSMLSMGCVVC